MSTIKTHIGKSEFTLHCRTGEEDNLHQAVSLVNREIATLQDQDPNLSEHELFLFVSLTLADKVIEARGMPALAPLSAPALALEQPAQTETAHDVKAHVYQHFVVLIERLEHLATEVENKMNTLQGMLEQSSE